MGGGSPETFFKLTLIIIILMIIIKNMNTPLSISIVIAVIALVAIWVWRKQNAPVQSKDRTLRAARIVHCLLNITWWITCAVGISVLLSIPFGLITGRTVLPALSGKLSVPVEIDPASVRYEVDPRPKVGGSDIVATGSPTLSSAKGELEVVVRGWGPRAIELLRLAVSFAAFAFVIYQLRQVFGLVVGGKPFDASNAARIRIVGWTVLLQEFAEKILLTMRDSPIQNAVHTKGITRIGDLGILFHGETIFLGLVVLAIAGAIRIGATLQEERDLTV